MINIDFGNSYTKVAIRVDQNSVAEPVKDSSLKFDRERLFFCIPTLAVQTNDFEFEYGINVLKVKDQDVLRVFRNWKPRFFEEGSQVSKEGNGQEPPPTPTETDWAKAYREHVKSCLDNDDDDAILSKKEFVTQEKSRIATITAKQKTIRTVDDETTDFEELGIGFFKWLREFVYGVCIDKGFSNVQDWATRITLPSLGGAASARIQLRKLLRESGWNIDSINPMLSEPHANYWGMMTEGKNAVWTPGKPGYGTLNPNYRAMLQGSKLWDRMRANRNARRDPIYWVLVADIGGFTVDFAMLGLNPYDPIKPTNDLHEGKSREEYESFPLGVRDLDSRLVKVLPHGHAEALQDMLLDKNASRLEQFHRDCYEGISKRKAVRMSKSVRLHTAEWPIVEECVEEFAKEVQKHAENFLVSHGYEHVDELLLTGGGFNIPTIRNGFFDFIKRWYTKPNCPTPLAFAPALKDEEKTLPQNMKRLDPLIVRGATALGGASVAFDYSDDF